jgi:proline iminopeptidase
MRRTYQITLALVALIASSLAAQTDQAQLYPDIKPLRSGYLKVSDIHSIYWEECGNPDGIPVIVLHGGPGGSAGPAMRRFFDPKRFRIILHDQRGAGRSKPTGEWRDNTTQLLIADINRLRDHLGVKGKAILFGGSWGSTLAVAYAEAHPDLVAGLVMRGIFLGSKSEIDYFYHGGATVFFPDNWERLRFILPNPEKLDYPRQLFEMTQSSDPATRKKAINGWAYYEIRMCSVNLTDEVTAQIIEQNEDEMMPFSVLENYYMMNGCFIDDDQLLREADRIADIPTFIVNGRFDAVCPPRTAYALAKKLKNVKLEFPPATGHVDSEPANREALLRGVRWVAEQIEKQ